MNIKTYLGDITRRLQIAYSDSSLARHNALLLLEKATGMSKIQLIMSHGESLSAQQHELVEAWITDIIGAHKPLQYILQSVPFGSLEILVEPPILIPRPETEEWVLDIAQRLHQIARDSALHILDLCTGSGCIGLLLAHTLPKAHIYASDINPAALALAEKNAHLNSISNITFIQSDLFNSLTPGVQYDLIVTNPPYISQKEWTDLEPTVKEWEDTRALVAPGNGLEIIETIITHAPEHLKLNTLLKNHDLPQLCIEIGHTQAENVKVLMKTHGYHDILAQKDLAGKDRVIMGRVDHVVHAKAHP